MTSADSPFENVEEDATPGMSKAPKVTVAKDDSDRTGMTVLVTVDNFGNGDVNIDFGDLTPRVGNPGDSTPVTHQYTMAGTYTVGAAGVTGGPTGTAQIVVPYVSPTQPTFLLGADKYKVAVTVTNVFLDNVYEVQWVPDGPWQTLVGTPPTATHNYPARSTSASIVVRYRDYPAITATASITLPAKKPQLGDWRDLAQDGRTWTIWVANPMSGKQYEIQWETGGRWEPLIGWLPHGHHTYTNVEYNVNAAKIRYKGDPPPSFTLGLPTPWKHLPPPLDVQAKDGVATVDVFLGYYGHSYEIQWDTDGPWEPMVNVGTVRKPAVATHAYPHDQESATVSVRDHIYPDLVHTTTLTLPDMQPTLVGTNTRDAETFGLAAATETAGDDTGSDESDETHGRSRGL